MNKTPRSYNQFCALAKALDIVGERWTLLITRELLSGPKRFKDLHDALPGIGTNLLSTRMKEMERHELVARGKLPPPAASAIYELTDRGRELGSVVGALTKWGFSLLGSPKPDESSFDHDGLCNFCLSRSIPKQQREFRKPTSSKSMMKHSTSV